MEQVCFCDFMFMFLVADACFGKSLWVKGIASRFVYFVFVLLETVLVLGFGEIVSLSEQYFGYLFALPRHIVFANQFVAVRRKPAGVRTVRAHQRGFHRGGQRT